MWSKKHNLVSCNSCGTDKVPHRAHGWCRNCYAKAKGYVWQKQYAKHNREKINQINRKWVEANPAIVRQSKRKWENKNRDKVLKHQKTWRKKNKAPFCIICGEKRCAEWAHLIPHSSGGPIAPWNLIPLCPTHHRCFDYDKLTLGEFALIEPYLDIAKNKHKKLLLERARVASSPST